MAITTEAEPFPFLERVGSFRSAEALRRPKSSEAEFPASCARLDSRGRLSLRSLRSTNPNPSAIVK